MIIVRWFPCVNRGLQIPLSRSGQASEGVERGTVGISSDWFKKAGKQRTRGWWATSTTKENKALHCKERVPEGVENEDHHTK